MTSPASKMSTVVAIFLAVTACNRSPDELWSARGVRIRPGRTLKVQEVVKVEKVEKVEEKKEEDFKPKLLELLKKAKVSRAEQDLAREKTSFDEISQLPKDKVQTHLRDIAITNVDELAEYAVKAIGRLKNKEFIPLLTKTLRGSDVYRSIAAADALGEIGNALANSQLVSILGDNARTPSVRAAAARALGKIGNKGAVEPLLEALRSDKDLLQVDAAMALGMLKDLRALEPLKAKLEEAKGSDPEVELELARTLLTYFQDPDATPIIVARLIGGTADVRKRATAILKEHPSKVQVGRLVVDLLAKNPGAAFEITEVMLKLCTEEAECMLRLKQKKKAVKRGPAVNACNQALTELKAAAAAAAPLEAGDAGGKKKKKKKKKKRKKRKKKKK